VVLDQPVPGPAAARNAGLRAALALDPPLEMMVLLDADCVAPPDWIAAHLSAMEAHPEWDAAGGPLRTSQFDNRVQEFIERQGIMDVAGFFRARPPQPPMVLTANMVIRRRALEKVGLLNEDLPVGEDADWCWRLQWAGGVLGYTEAAAVEHRHRTTVRAFARMMVRYGQGSIRAHRLHRERLGPLAWDWVGAGRLIKALVKCLAIPVRRLTPYQKAEAPLEVVRYGAFLWGRWTAWLLG
jgi:GT2 family glycosyltransferase